jgi:hypothetical protein
MRVQQVVATAFKLHKRRVMQAPLLLCWMDLSTDLLTCVDETRDGTCHSF